MTTPYASEQPSRAQIESLAGAAIVQFGTDWCGHCQAAEPLIEMALTAWPELQRTKVEDGQGRALGRFFRVKLWPTLVFLKDGREVARVVRPRTQQEIEQALSRLARA